MVNNRCKIYVCLLTILLDFTIEQKFMVSLLSCKLEDGSGKLW